MLRLGGAGAGGAAAGALVAAAGGALTGGLLDTSPAAAASLPSPTDADRLRRLISVELLMLYCYEHVLAGPLLRPRAHRLMLPLRGQEEAHVRVLSSRLAALGGTPPAGPASVKEADRDLARRGVGGRLNQLQGGRDALFLLLAVEQVVVGAYFVALTKLSDPRLVVLAAQIMANDAQHEALVGEALHPGHAEQAVPYGLVQGIQ
jgi:Ferritin-like domain